MPIKISFGYKLSNFKIYFAAKYKKALPDSLKYVALQPAIVGTKYRCLSFFLYRLLNAQCDHIAIT